MHSMAQAVLCLWLDIFNILILFNNIFRQKIEFIFSFLEQELEHEQNIAELMTLSRASCEVLTTTRWRDFLQWRGGSSQTASTASVREHGKLWSMMLRILILSLGNTWELLINHIKLKLCGSRGPLVAESSLQDHHVTCSLNLCIAFINTKGKAKVGGKHCSCVALVLIWYSLALSLWGKDPPPGTLGKGDLRAASGHQVSPGT